MSLQQQFHNEASGILYMGIIGALFTLALVQKETEAVIAVAVVVSALLAALLALRAARRASAQAQAAVEAPHE